MNVGIIKHHIPQLRSTKSNFAYVSPYCCFCNTEDAKSRIFRLNLKLKVFKCYNCGISGKSDISFIRLLKISKENSLDALNKAYLFEVQTCKTEQADSLPF